MDDQIAVSFAGLVKNNNGMFKSEKQAAFLLSKCIDNEYEAVSSVYGNSYTNTYLCDSKGVVKVVHYTHQKGESLIWERVENDKLTVQEEKQQKRIKREIKRIEKQIAEREAAKDQYKDQEWLYNQSMETDQKMLEGYKSQLK